ncbi:MAG: radical SAM protein, partial [Leptotrichia sp.]|nr:radical SAM protein [Leptotrichia sp.]
MITANIDINKNKLEEFVRVLLPEYYEILSENTEKNICITVNETLQLITVKSSVIIGDKTVKETELSYEKIGHDYFDQAEVMTKTSLLKLFGKEKEYKWGALIGVRPTKIAGRFLNMGLSYEKIEEILKNIYFVSNEKIKLLLGIVKRQEKYLDRKTIGVYIGVAFCPTKCTYCSFPAYLLKGKYAERYNEYIESLYDETAEIGKFSKEEKLKINTIYIGGGTPSILSAEEIEKLLLTVKENYDLQSLREFTFEAGRIDTLDREKLEILKKYGVDKISINPQSFNEKTLKLVNRYHNREEFDNVYSIAKEIGLKINMDLILGLPGETTE